MQGSVPKSCKKVQKFWYLYGYQGYTETCDLLIFFFIIVYIVYISMQTKPPNHAQKMHRQSNQFPRQSLFIN